jgi:hypothetical protein
MEKQTSSLAAADNLMLYVTPIFTAVPPAEQNDTLQGWNLFSIRASAPAKKVSERSLPHYLLRPACKCAGNATTVSVSCHAEATNSLWRDTYQPHQLPAACSGRVPSRKSAAAQGAEHAAARILCRQHSVPGRGWGELLMFSWACSACGPSA